MKNTIEETKTHLETLSFRADNIEERISNIEDSNAEMLQMEEERELRLKRNEETLREISNSRKSNIRIISIPREKRGKKEQRTCSKK